MKDLVSIIVPVYNVQKYLDKCIESMLKQTYTNIEIVLVDDGSTDGSASICDKYAADDERVVVVHKKNGGQSDARNVGLEKSTGEYICWVDGDDCIEENMIELLHKNLVDNNADISICNYHSRYESDNRKCKDITVKMEYGPERISGIIIIMRTSITVLCYGIRCLKRVFLWIFIFQLEEYQKMHGLWERLSAMQKQYMLQMQTAMSIRYEEAAVCRQVW